MTHPPDNRSALHSALDRRPWSWLLLGAVLLVASQLRFGIGVLAWLAPVPFLHYLRITERWPSRVAFLAASLVAYTLAIAKIITAPLPLAFAPLFGLPIGLVLSLPLLAIGPLRRQLGEAPAALGFSALMVTAEWTLHGLLPFGTWCSAANTQLDHLALMQLASVTGLHGVSFLVYAFAAALESVLAAPSPGRRRALAGVAVAIVAASALGQARLAASTASGTARTEVATVDTDSTIGAGPLPTQDELRAVNENLFRRSRAAADAGVALIVWTEAATMVMPEDEARFLGEASAFARDEDVTLVAAYIVPISFEPLRYRNRYAFVTPGGVDHVYDKHHPVPGEPAVAGDARMPLFESEALGRVSGAILLRLRLPAPRPGARRARRRFRGPALLRLAGHRPHPHRDGRRAGHRGGTLARPLHPLRAVRGLRSLGTGPGVAQPLRPGRAGPHDEPAPSRGDHDLRRPGRLVPAPVWHRRLRATGDGVGSPPRVCCVVVADTVLSVASRAILDAYEQLGLDGDALLNAAGLAREEVRDPDRRIPAARADALFAAAYARADDPHLALHAAEALPFGAYKVVDFLCAHSATVAEAYRRIAAYFALVDVRAQIEVRESPPSLVMRSASGQPVPPPAQEYTFAALIRRMALCVGDDFHPQAVELSFDAPPDASEHQRVFGAPVRFGAPKPRVLFDEATFHASIRDANPALASVLEDHARRLVGELPAGDDLAGQVRAAIAEQPDSGAATVKSVAKRLAMSERTLSRRLRERDLTFGQLKAESRFALARTHLGDPSLSLAEVAWLLGFADQSAFTRAFRRWSGKPPGEFRREER